LQSAFSGRADPSFQIFASVVPTLSQKARKDGATAVTVVSGAAHFSRNRFSFLSRARSLGRLLPAPAAAGTGSVGQPQFGNYERIGRPRSEHGDGPAIASLPRWRSK